MRHSGINLTMSRYSHTFRRQTSKAIQGLPDFSAMIAGHAKATGTDEKSFTHQLTHPSDFSRNHLSSVGTSQAQKVMEGGNCNTLKNGTLGNKTHHISPVVKSGPGWTRTSDQSIMSRLVKKCKCFLRKELRFLVNSALPFVLTKFPNLYSV